jgi:hypothetical protein
METYTVCRSKLLLCIGYFLAESTLITILAAMLVIWQDEPSYLDWPVAITSWIACTVFFHSLLFAGTFYCLHIDAENETIEYHAFLKKTKRLLFSDIVKVEHSVNMDVKVVGINKKKLFYVKQTDRNFDRFISDISAYTKI